TALENERRQRCRVRVRRPEPRQLVAPHDRAGGERRQRYTHAGRGRRAAAAQLPFAADTTPVVPLRVVRVNDAATPVTLMLARQAYPDDAGRFADGLDGADRARRARHTRPRPPVPVHDPPVGPGPDVVGSRAPHASDPATDRDRTPRRPGVPARFGGLGPDRSGAREPDAVGRAGDGGRSRNPPRPQQHRTPFYPARPGPASYPPIC